MNSNKHVELSNEQLEDILVAAVSQKIRFRNPDLQVTTDTKLKADAELDVFDFGDILVCLFIETDLMIQYEVLIGWFAKSDCCIKELAVNIIFIKNNY